MAATIHLKIVTPDSLVFDGDIESLIVRTVEGDVCILPRHIDYMVALGDGEAHINLHGSVRKAHCSGGMLHVTGGSVINLLSTHFEWAE